MAATGARRYVFRALGILGVGGAGLAYSLERTVRAQTDQLHSPSYHWPHFGWFSSHDHASIRRGYEVYKNVCQACHSIKFIRFRHTVNVFLTENEAKEEAAQYMYEDGPDEEGKMYMRPGKLTDPLPSPYPNEEAAKFANNGAIPPDLSLIVLARHGGEDYVFSILTGYCDPPAGFKLDDGLHFNPYFAGGAIAMARSLYNGTIEYEDGTPATASQLAKDVTIFLSWCAEINHDERKLFALRFCLIMPPLLALITIYQRFVWSTLRTQKFVFKRKSK